MQSVGCKISIRHFLVAIKILHFKIGPNALKKRVYITVGSVSLSLYGGVPENLEYVYIFKMKNYIMNKTCKTKVERGITMQYVYVKDAEGYVFKKLKSEVCKDEKIISEKAYLKASGFAYYEKEFGHTLLDRSRPVCRDDNRVYRRVANFPC